MERTSLMASECRHMSMKRWRRTFPVGSGNFGDAKFAYPPGGGSFYVFDVKTRVLSKYAQWW